MSLTGPMRIHLKLPEAWWHSPAQLCYLRHEHEQCKSMNHSLTETQPAPVVYWRSNSCAVVHSKARQDVDQRLPVWGEQPISGRV
jgi:hypothetical protein